MGENPTINGGVSVCLSVCLSDESRKPIAWPPAILEAKQSARS